MESTVRLWCSKQVRGNIFVYADVRHQTTFVIIFTQFCLSTVVISLWCIYSFESNICWCISCSFVHVSVLEVNSVGLIRMCKALVTSWQYCVRPTCVIVITGYHSLKAVVRELVDFTQAKFGQWLCSYFDAHYKWDTPTGPSLIILLLFVIAYKWWHPLVNLPLCGFFWIRMPVTELVIVASKVCMFVSIHLMTCRHFWQCPSISWLADTFDNVCVHS